MLWHAAKLKRARDRESERAREQESERAKEQESKRARERESERNSQKSARAWNCPCTIHCRVATHCNTHCSTLQHAATHYSTQCVVVCPVCCSVFVPEIDHVQSIAELFFFQQKNRLWLQSNLKYFFSSDYKQGNVRLCFWKFAAISDYKLLYTTILSDIQWLEGICFIEFAAAQLGGLTGSEFKSQFYRRCV